MAIQIANEENFAELIKEGFVIVDFYGATCVPCKAFSQILEDLEAQIPFVNIVKLCTTDYPVIARQNRVMAVPTIHFYKDGQLMEKHVGVMEEEDLKDKIAEYLYA